jgi:hypothetical protein
MTDHPITSRPRPGPAKRAAMAACLLAFLVLFLEAALRIMGIGGSIVYQDDPACGYLPVPDQRFSTMGHPITILSNGYRGPVASSDTLFIGDSVTYGTAYVRDEDTFPALLGGVNAAVNGWGIQNAAGYLKSRPLTGITRAVLVIPTCDVLRPFTTLRKGLISTNRRMWLRLEYLARFVWYGFIKTQPTPDDPLSFDGNVNAVIATHENLGRRGIAFFAVILPSREEAAGQPAPQEADIKLMLEKLRVAGVTCIVLKASGNPSTLYRDTAHLTAEGNRWVAKDLREQLNAP